MQILRSALAASSLLILSAGAFGAPPEEPPPPPISGFDVARLSGTARSQWTFMGEGKRKLDPFEDRRIVRVEMDPEKLRALKLSVDDVMRPLIARNLAPLPISAKTNCITLRFEPGEGWRDPSLLELETLQLGNAPASSVSLGQVAALTTSMESRPFLTVGPGLGGNTVYLTLIRRAEKGGLILLTAAALEPRGTPIISRNPAHLDAVPGPALISDTVRRIYSYNLFFSPAPYAEVAWTNSFQSAGDSTAHLLLSPSASSSPAAPSPSIQH